MGTISFYEAPDGRYFEARGHEGYVGMLFADGAVGSGSGPDGITVSTSADGTELAYEQWQHRPASAVVGWVWMCECGWRGEPWLRAGAADDADVAARVVYSPDEYQPDPIEEDTQWSSHARPLAILAYVEATAHEVRVANDAL